MSLNEIKQNAVATGRGIKKAWQVTIGLAEAMAWGVALAVLGYILYQTLKGNMTLSDIKFALISLSFLLLSGRILYEGARYFRDLGQKDSKA